MRKCYEFQEGARCSAVGLGTTLRVRFPMVSLEFFIDIIDIILRPDYQEYFLLVKAAGA